MSGHTSEYALYEPIGPYPDQDHQDYEHTCTEKTCNVGADLEPVRQKLFRPIRYICHFISFFPIISQYLCKLRKYFAPFAVNIDKEKR